MLETELAFVSNIEDIAKEAELLLKSVTNYVVEKGGSDLRAIDAPEPHWLDKNFGIATYDEVTKILDNHADRLTFPLKYGDSLSKEHELFLVQHNNGVPIFVVEFPKDSKPFYMKGAAKDSTKVNINIRLI